MPPAAKATIVAAGERRRRKEATGPPVTGRSADELEPAIERRANARSRADWKRSAGRFSRQRCTTASNAAGREPVSVASDGSSRRIAVIVSGAVAARKARRPEAIS